MKNRIIVTTAITACLALCAAVWPQNEAVEETPAPNETTIVSTPKATVEELETEAETVPPTEKEKAEIPQQEQNQEAAPEPESVPAPEATRETVPEQNTEPPATQESIKPPSGNMVYVEGFGWIENRGPNHVEYAEDMDAHYLPQA